MSRRRRTNEDLPKYRIEIHWSPEDDAYVVKVPELPGCMTHGRTLDEAVLMAQEAIGLYIETLERSGRPVPRPLSSRKFSGKIPLRIDPVLHRDLSVRAEVEGLSLNKFIEKRLKKAN